MGLWQKLFGWLNPSAPTAALPADGAAAPSQPAVEPAFDGQPLPPGDVLDGAAAAASATDTPAATAAHQADLFEAGAADSSADDALRAVQPPPPIQAPWFSPALQGVLSVYAGMAWERQIDFSEKIGERPWSVDMSTGRIQFGDDLPFSMQVLGTYALQSGTWQWIWAHTQAPVAPAFTEVAKQLRSFGAEQKLALLTQPRTEMDEQDLHLIGLIASGADESAGYFLGNYGEGVMLVLVDPGHGLPVARHAPERVISTVPQVISQFDVDHRVLLQHYLEAKGFAVQEVGQQIMGQQGSQRITAELDAQGRIASLNGKLG